MRAMITVHSKTFHQARQASSKAIRKEDINDGRRQLN